MAVKIIIDSTADIPQDLRSRFVTVPLTVCFGQQEYVDGVTITYQTFYEKLMESDVLPTTSQATPDAFSQVFRQVTQAGDTAVVLTIASTLSGTWQSAMIAAQDYPGIHVVDTESAAIGSGILAQRALSLADSGMDAQSIARQLEQERSHVRVIALLDTLEYLKRGGRISKTVAFAGELLNLKPVLSVENGQISMLGKARGSKQGNNLLFTEIQKTGGVDFTRPVLLGYTGLSDALLQKYVQDSRQLWEEGGDAPAFTPIGSVIGTHAGPGAIAAAFFTKG